MSPHGPPGRVRRRQSLCANPEALVEQLALRCSALDHCASREAPVSNILKWKLQTLEYFFQALNTLQLAFPAAQENSLWQQTDQTNLSDLRRCYIVKHVAIYFPRIYFSCCIRVVYIQPWTPVISLDLTLYSMLRHIYTSYSFMQYHYIRHVLSVIMYGWPRLRARRQAVKTSCSLWQTLLTQSHSVNGMWVRAGDATLPIHTIIFMNKIIT